MKNRKFIVLLAAVILAAVSAFAQGNTGTVKGKATDEKGQPIAGATVRFNGTEGNKFELQTDPQGQYEKTGVPAGKYTIELLIEGHKRWAGAGEVAAGETDIMNIDLAAAAAAAKMTPEQRKQMEKEAEEKQKKAQAEHNKIKNLNTMLAQAKPMMDTGNYDGALAIYQNAVNTDPTKDLLWFDLGTAYLGKTVQTKDKDESATLANKAIEAFQKALSISPNVGAYHNNLAQAFVRAGKNDDALKEFQTAAQMDPTQAARYYFNAGATLTNQSTKLPPSSPEQKKTLDEANEMFRKSAAADPKFSDGEAYYQLATNLLSQATMSKDNKMIVPDGTTQAYQKYLEVAPTGRYAESAKQTLAALGSTVETGYKAKGGKKK